MICFCFILVSLVFSIVTSYYSFISHDFLLIKFKTHTATQEKAEDGNMPDITNEK